MRVLYSFVNAWDGSRSGIGFCKIDVVRDETGEISLKRHAPIYCCDMTRPEIALLSAYKAAMGGLMALKHGGSFSSDHGSCGGK
jgi:hypothetical protein